MTIWRHILFVAVLLTRLLFAQTNAPHMPVELSQAPRRVEVAPDVASALILQKIPIKYPESLRNAGTQGEVVLKVIVSSTGDVEDASRISGDSGLAAAAIESVKGWKYKPYILEGSVTDFETRISITFRLQSNNPTPLELGSFSNDRYVNKSLALEYPLPQQWVRETTLIRNQFSQRGATLPSVLLAALYIPHNASLSQADSTFTLLAVARSASQTCPQYLDGTAADLESHKDGRRNGATTDFASNGRVFFRLDIQPQNHIGYHSLICSESTNYFLLWNIFASKKEGLDIALSTIHEIPAPGQPYSGQPGSDSQSPDHSIQQAPSPQTDQLAATNGATTPMMAVPQRVRVSQGVSTGLLIKKVQPIYPVEARAAHIQGQVLMRAVISRAGDIEELEILEGPPELVVSAVNAVREWKYRPYFLKGEPIAVETQIVVNYTLSWR